MILSDLGAEIIKVEHPQKGDDSRIMVPFCTIVLSIFASINHGKKSISLNLKKPQGRELLLELIKQCDVLVENFRPGTMEKI